LQIQAKTFRESGGFFGYVRSGKQTGVEAMRIEPMLRFNGLANVYLVPESISCLALSADLRGNKFEKLMFPRGMFLKAGTNCNFKLILKYANQEGQNFYFAIDSFSIPTKTPVKACLSTSTGSSKRNLISPAINGKCQKGYKLVK
jgi:hypothetical protein